MTTEDRKVIRVSAESEAIVRKYAEKNEIPVGEAADKLLSTADSRLKALARHAKNRKAEGKPAKKRTAKKKRSAANGAAAHA